MFNSTERFLAWKFLRAKRQERFISVVSMFAFLGILLGVATLIVVTAVMNGFRQEFVNRIIGFNGHLAVYGQMHYPLVDYDNLRKDISHIDDVSSVTPLVNRQVMIAANSRVQGGLVHGISYEDLKSRNCIKENIKAGVLAEFSSENSIVIGTKMSRKLNVKIGDSITLLTPEMNETGFGFVPRSKTFKIVSIFEVGMSDYDANVVFIPLEIAQKLFKMSQSVDSLEVFVKSPLKIEKTTNDIKDKFSDNVEIGNWQTMNKSFTAAIQVQKNVLFLILSLMVIIASFNIISSMVMLVRDKSKGIAILRTIGATKGSILRIFLMAGSSIGIFGTVGGLALGLLISCNIEKIRQWLQYLLKMDLFPDEVYFLSNLPSVVEPSEVIITTITALVLSFLATIYPSWRASKVDPVEVLRYE